MLDFSETPVTLLLLIVNLLVSGYALFFDPSLVDRLAFKPREIMREGEVHRLISAGFVHVSGSHLLFNMITLYFFGQPMEYVLGPGKFLILYFGAELAAHGLSLVLHRETAGYAAVGASGAISGVLFGYCLFAPLQPIYIFFIPIGIPAALFAVAYVFLSMYAMRQGRNGGMTGGIAHEAHLGGAVGGLLLTILLEPRSIGVFLREIGSINL
jgi:membrane associated rhomboid family serine protease